MHCAHCGRHWDYVDFDEADQHDGCCLGVATIWALSPAGTLTPVGETPLFQYGPEGATAWWPGRPVLDPRTTSV